MEEENNNVIIDLIKAHWKAIITAITVVVIQEVDQETIDWAAAVLGSILVVIKENNPASVARIYRNRR